jgi:FkbM family methyltransferase
VALSRLIPELRNKFGRTRLILGHHSRRRELLRAEFWLSLRRYLPSSGELRLKVADSSDGRGGYFFFGSTTFRADRKAYFGIFLSRWYETDYHDAAVIDVGAHKGYYGGYALLSGARAVISCEPEHTNFSILAKSANQFDGGSSSWTIRNVAVASSGGEVALYTSDESDSHSILQRPDRKPSGMQRTTVVSFAALIEEAADLGARRLIAKIDPEGAECEIVLGTPAYLWKHIDEVFIEWHSFAPCTSESLDEHLSAAGLILVRREGTPKMQLLHFARPSQELD